MRPGLDGRYKTNWAGRRPDAPDSRRRGRPMEGPLMRISRVFWIGFGVFTHLLFVGPVGRLFPFLQRGGGSRGLLAPAVGTSRDWCLADAMLAVQFGVVHSTLLL